jgi:tetratricopeptide (TPR) repeat protein
MCPSNAGDSTPLERSASQASLLDRAREAYGRGALREAVELCEVILRAAPLEYEALTLLGVMAAGSGQLEAAGELLGRAAVARPEHAAAHNNVGNVLKRLRRLEEALGSYERALGLEPRYVEAHYNRGATLHELGRLGGALESYERALALKGDYAEAHCARGNTLRELERLGEALESYGRAVELRAGYLEAHYNRGATLHELKRWGEALESYGRVLELKPTLPEAHYNRGNVLRELKRWGEALESYERAIGLRGTFAAAHLNRGLVLKELKRPEEALESYRRALELEPADADAHNNAGNVLLELRRYEEALGSYERALELAPRNADAHNNRGNVLLELRRLEEALASYDRAIDLSPTLPQAFANRGTALLGQLRVPAALQSYQRAIDLQGEFSTAHYCLGMALLLAGELERGWREFEWRFRDEHSSVFAERHRFKEPRWLGEETLKNRTILVHHEQGLGDTIQFSRYVSELAARGARVIVEVPPELARLMASLEGVWRVVTRGETLPAFDYHCPMMSLPLASGTTLSTIPANMPYLRSTTPQWETWRARLGTSEKLRVGLVWSGGLRPQRPEIWGVNRRRNIALSMLRCLKNSEVEFHSLQKGQSAESELAALVAQGWDGPPIIDHTSLLEDFSETAALIEQLDLVISVDTSTAHLAGALGKPVWLLNRYDTCWRWMLERTDSPWYPTLRLYRQRRDGDWADVLERVAADLRAGLATKREGGRMSEVY